MHTSIAIHFFAKNKTNCVAFMKKRLLLKVAPLLFVMSRFKDETPAAALSAAAMIYSKALEVLNY